MSQFPRLRGFKQIGLAALILTSTGIAMLQGQRISNPEDALLVSKSLKHIKPNGDLQSAFVIIETEVYKKLGIPCLLMHGFRAAYDRNPRSTWFFAGLNTYLVPDGRDHLRWQPLSGASGLFTLSKIGSEFPATWTGPCTMRRVDSQQYEIKTRDGTVWKYQNGILTNITISGFGTVLVECRGSHISSLKIEGEPLAEIEVIYDEEMHPLRISNFGVLVGIFTWDASGLLKSWSYNSNGTLKFDYTDSGLLSKMTFPGASPIAITWRENIGWQRGDSKWPLPVHLAQFGEEFYNMSLETRGVVIKISSETAPVIKKEFCYNPITNKAQFRIGEQVHKMQFER